MADNNHSTVPKEANVANTLSTPDQDKDGDANPSGSMDYLDSIQKRFITVFLPLGIFVFVLLFPFFWMAITSIKPDAELLSHEGNPFWVVHPTLVHFQKLLFEVLITLHGHL